MLFSLFLIVQIRALINIFIVFVFRETTNKFPVDSTYKEYPFVLIQIPVYMEGLEVQNCILAAFNVNYPKNKFCVQVIDDSPNKIDEFVNLMNNKAKQRNIEFMYLFRPNREGFKSGALNYGMSKKRSDLILVLDADFVIAKNFLNKTTEFFANKKVACVQTRWQYRNKFNSGIITVQTTIFETLFALEQLLRKKLNIPAFFTGTSGVWRSSIIDEIGGWREKPFTAEDIDLSFKAYNSGYKMIFVDESLSNCEATPDYMALKRQQQRWARGVIQAGLHNGKKIFSANQSLKSKLQEIGTGLFNFVPILLLLLTFNISIFILFDFNLNKRLELSFLLFTLLIAFGPLSLGIILAVNRYNTPLNFSKIFQLFWAACLGVGISWSMIFGLWEVITKSKREFVVTPKGNNFKKILTKKTKRFSEEKLKVFLEGFIFLYFGYISLICNPNYKVAFPIMLFTCISGLVSLVSSIVSQFKASQNI